MKSNRNNISYEELMVNLFDTLEDEEIITNTVSFDFMSKYIELIKNDLNDRAYNLEEIIWSNLFIKNENYDISFKDRTIKLKKPIDDEEYEKICGNMPLKVWVVSKNGKLIDKVVEEYIKDTSKPKKLILENKNQ